MAGPVTVIDAFEVPPDSDEAFVAGWERDLSAAGDGFSSTALYRALRADVTLRYVSVAPLDSPNAAGEAGFPGTALPFTGHPALYEVAHDDGEPDGAGGVVLINPFEAPSGQDERFLTDWEALRDRFAARQGYLGTRLHRSIGPADFRFVDIVRWSSPLMFARALQEPGIGQAAANRPFPGRPALYLRVAADGAASVYAAAPVRSANGEA